MSNVVVRLLHAYRRHGYEIRTGLNPFYFANPDAPFTRLIQADGQAVSVGGGMAFQEVQFLESLFSAGLRPARILVIGNSFGWSALALAMLNPGATLVAMDAGLEGDSTSVGTVLTRAIAAEEGLDVRVVEATSPQDVPRVIHDELSSGRLDVVLIDGFHANEQLRLDFAAILPFMSPACLVLCHDVLHWHMVEAFTSLNLPVTHERAILTRTPSGIGVIYPRAIDAATRDIIEAFRDHTIDLAALHADLGAKPGSVGPLLANRLAGGWKQQGLYVARQLASAGQREAAENRLAQVAAAGADDADLQMAIAAHHIDHDAWTQAEPLLRRAVRLRPDWELPLHHLARCMKQQGQDDLARSMFVQVIGLKPDWAAAHYELGLLVTKVDGDAAALSHFQRAAECAPAWSAAWFQVGLRQFRCGDARSAIAALERAILLDPRSAAAHHILGLAWRRLGQNHTALKSLESAAALNPSSTHTQYDLGVAQRHCRDFAAAAESLSRAMTLDPSWAPPVLQLGLLHVDQGNDAAAIPVLEAASSLDRKNGTSCHVLGLAYRRRGEARASLRWLEEAKRRSPESAAIQRDLQAALQA